MLTHRIATLLFFLFGHFLAQSHAFPSPSGEAVMTETKDTSVPKDMPTGRPSFHANHPTIVENIENVAGSAGRFVVDEVQRTILAGNIWSFFEKLAVAPWKEIWNKVFKILEWKDLVFLMCLGWATVPMTQYYHTNNAKRKMMKARSIVKDFRNTISFQVADHVSQIAKIALLVYAVDLLKIICMGFIEWKPLGGMSQTFAKLAYTVWLARRLSILKRYLIMDRLLLSTHMQHDQLGRRQIIDRLGDAALLALVGVAVIDILSVDLGIAGLSVFAFGGATTLIISLAAQDMAKQIMSGLLLSASDRIYEGDFVEFSNGIKGTVAKLGWVETVLRGSDEILMSVPNTDLSSQRVCNLSRLRKCQVKQTLRFPFKDIDKLEQLILDMKEEIRQSCPALIRDGTRPFRIVWTDYEKDALVVKVDAHFDIRPIGDDYWTNRERVLRAINRAVEKNGVHFLR